MAAIIWQLAAFAAKEAGFVWPLTGQGAHLVLLITAVPMCLMIANGRFSIRISPKGWDLRYFPFQLYYQHLDWDEIKIVSRVPPEDLPPNAQFGFPIMRFTRLFLLTNPRYEVLRLDLINGGQIYFSTKNANELILFLQKEMVFALKSTKSATNEIGHFVK
ncbi:MAG: hypothetical protein WCR52_20575 [Bacteroidota bacterium]